MRFRLVLLTALLTPTALLAQQQPRPVMNGGLPAVSPSGQVIAFLSNRSGTNDIYLTSPDGTQLIRLTNNAAMESAPFWAHGDRVVFSVWADNASTVFTASQEAMEPRIVGKVSGRSPIVSPDGKKLIYSTGQFPTLHIEESALDGSAVRQITKVPSMQFNAVYSPDQKQIAFARADSTRQLQLFVMNADGTGERQLTRFSADDGSPQWPSWSPDGTRVAVQSGKYNRNAPAENTAHIWIVDVKSGTPTRLNPHSTPYLDETPSWFPDGRRIAFQSDRSGRMEVWVMNADGTGAAQVTK